MFRKFDEKESISAVSQLKTSVQKGIRNQIVELYPEFEEYLLEFWPKKDCPARLVKCHEKIELLVVNNEALFFKQRDGPWLPNLHVLHQFPFMLPIQIVDKGAIKFILSGAHIMCPGITSKGAFLNMDTPKGTPVQIMCEGKEHAIAIGTMVMEPSEIANVNKGIGIEVAHYLNDGLWHLKDRSGKESMAASGGELSWYFSQVKGSLDDDVAEADIISAVEFNHDGELLATGDKGGRVVIFQRSDMTSGNRRSSEFNVYSTFQSHEGEFDYLKSLEIEEKINKIRWLPRRNAAHFLLSTNDKTIKLWKVSERDRIVNGYNLKNDDGTTTSNRGRLNNLVVPRYEPAELMVEASPKKVYANAHAYHVNSISVNSDNETYLSADDLRVNLWHLEITDRSFNIIDIKPANMEDLAEVITAAEFHPTDCSSLVYSSSKGTIRLCDMRDRALCDNHAKQFEEPEEPNSRSFFSEIIGTISDVKFSHSGRYLLSRDYLTVKVWDLHMENKPIMSMQVHPYLTSKLCNLYENDCIFDKFECCWSGTDSAIMTGSYNNFFRIFDLNKKDVTLEASKNWIKPKAPLKPKKVFNGVRKKKEEVSVDSLDFHSKVLHSAWHPKDNIIAIAATNNLFIYDGKR